MNTLEMNEIKVDGLKKINVLMGRNGAGKSRLLRAIDEYSANNGDYYVRYISPERAGVFKRDGNILTNMENNPDWIKYARRVNQAQNFKAASANLLREVETAYLRKLQDNPEIRLDSSRNFRTERLDSINRLLLNLTIHLEGSDFVFKNHDGDIIQPDNISSGESESVALAVEIMYFFDNLKKEKKNILLLDEPDVHLHPDLQARLAMFIINLVENLDEQPNTSVSIILATHSTPLICALSQSNQTTIGTKNFGSHHVLFKDVSHQIKKIAPFFGHPLSLSLNQDIMLIIEGEDDERVWQQAARTSQGKIKLFPVISTSVDQQTQLEKFTADMINSLYDEPKAYSLRDGDGIIDDLAPIKSLTRFRLKCYAVENLLVTDQVLQRMGKTWDSFKDSADNWIKQNPHHCCVTTIQKLITSQDRMRNIKIKEIRQLICAICDYNKPWEVIVGQSIGSIDILDMPSGEFDLPTFIGIDATKVLLSTVS